MTEPTPANPLLRTHIHFDTLWASARDALAVYAGQSWTDTGEHDPGVTLLQALTYLVSDLSYRHTLPLVDLLTPPVAQQRADGGIFAAEFGPQTALTCGPVTLEDYRRAILDLTTWDTSYRKLGAARVPPASGGEATYCFRDVQIAPEPVAERYWYLYRSTSATDNAAFWFGGVDAQAGDKAYAVGGRYRLWLTLNPGIDKAHAQTILELFLLENRNLCEDFVTPATLLDDHSFQPDLVLDLQDDFQDIAGLLVDVYLATDAWCRPAAVRATATALSQAGRPAEAIYAGPRLDYGWITALPPALPADTYTRPHSLSLAPLLAALQRLPGVAQAQSATVAGRAAITLPPGQRALAWGPTLGKGACEQVALALQKHVSLRKRGQVVALGQAKADPLVVAKLAAAVATAVSAKDYRRPLRQLAYGRHRQPQLYVSAGALLPPIYGLQDEPARLSEAARQLLQFLQPFEQSLADGGDQLQKLPSLLSFDQRSPQAAVWGAQWPTTSQPEPAARIDQALRSDDPATPQRLRDTVERSALDPEKELALLDHLLGYFGHRRAPRALLAQASGDPAAPFRAVQQGYLHQVTRLDYKRAAIRINEVSALQRRIAARLGVAPELFAEDAEANLSATLSALPFYLIEHRELLPAAPAPGKLTSDWQKVAKLEHPNPAANSDVLRLTLQAGNGIRPGQLIELLAPGATIPIVANVIHQVVSQNDTSVVATIDLDQHERLKWSVQDPTLLQKPWQWRYSQVWLKRVIYPLAYAQDQPKPEDAETTLKAGPSFPLEWSHLAPGELAKHPPTITLREKTYWQTKTATVPKPAALVPATFAVTELDPLRGTLKAKKTAGQWPAAKDLQQYGWAIDYGDEAFSFTLSVVLNRVWLGLAQQGDPRTTDGWIRQIVREEVPAHIVARIHWLDPRDFANFAGVYAKWRSAGMPVGDQSYSLLYYLSIGQVPADKRTGIGFVRIAGDSQQKALAASKDFPAEFDKAQVLYVGDAKTQPAPKY